MKTAALMILGLLLALPAMGQARSTKPNGSIPILLSANLPTYPPVWRTAHITGKVTALVTVRHGRVIETHVKSGNHFLRPPTIQNLKSWRFAKTVDAQFTVTFTFELAGSPTDAPTNPKVEILPSLDVIMTGRPIKPTVNY